MSMGGLVARYALAEMERPTNGRTSENHEVCQYYSHDSPHEGAYAPVAGVAALIHASTLGVGVGTPNVISVGIPFKDMIPELQGVLNMAYSPAARQMAKESVQLWSSQLVHTVSTEHQAFMNEYNALGYPTRCRNFAISNGGTQGAGSTSQIAPYAEMVRITGNAMDNFGLLSPILGAFAFFQIDSYAGINWAALASFIPLGSSGLETEVILNALPHRQVRRVYSLRITQVKNVLWLIPVRSDLTNNRMDSRPNCVAWENAPGGQYQIPIATNPANINLNNWFVSVNNNVNLNINRFGFVPTLSSIDFGGTAAGNHENIYDVIPTTNGIVTVNTGFISAYTPQNNNEVHIAFNRPNANWWLPQLDAGCTTVNCNGLDQISIRGRNILCTNTTETYTIDLPTGATAQWTVSPSNLVNLTVVSSNIIRLTPIDATSRGWLTVSVEVSSNACNFQRTFSQEIWVGEMSPITTIDNNPLYDGCLTFQETFALLANEAQAATSIRWFVTRNNMSEVEVISAANQRRWNTAIRVLPGDTEKLTVRVVADNGCSQSSYTDVFEYSLPAGRPRCNPPVGGRTIEPLLKLYPNPTAFLLNITIENLNSPIEQVVVRNSIGTVVLQTNSLNFTAEKTVELSLGNLPEGIYFLTVTLQDGQQLSQKVVVQRSGVAN